MKSPKAGRKYLVAAWAVWYAGDIFVTLYAQLPTYWSSGFENPREANQVARYALEVHPSVFVTGAILYAVVFSAAICYAPKFLAWWLSVGLLLAHFGGMKSWMPDFLGWDYFFYWESVLNAIAAAFAAYCYLKASKSEDIKI